MKNTFGFIGAGNMGGALAAAVAKTVSADCLFISDLQAQKAAALAGSLGCATATAEQIAAQCQYIFLGVKPQVMATLLTQLQPALSARKTPFVLVSMAAGISMADIQKMAGSSYPVIRIMPNLPVQAGQGTVLYDATENVTEENLSDFRAAMVHAGLLDRLAEKLIDAGSAVSGCGPAFVCLFVEALCDGGVTCGLTRQQATDYALQTLLGTAALLQQTGMHPGALKDAVCSPGGSTIAGVAALEAAGFRAGVIDAVCDAYRRTCQLGK